MKKNLLPFAAFMFLCAVFFVAAGALPLSLFAAAASGPSRDFNGTVYCGSEKVS